MTQKAQPLPSHTPQVLVGARVAENAQPTYLSRPAVLALVLASWSLVFPPLGGLAILLGFVARTQLSTAQNLRGSSIASAALTVGSFSLLSTATALGMWLGSLETPNLEPAPSRATPASLRSASSHHHTQTQNADMDAGVTEKAIGRVNLVEIGRGIESLDQELRRQQTVALLANEQALLWVGSDECPECDRIQTGLNQPLLQRAFRKTRLIRVNAEEFAFELRHLHVPTDCIGGFGRIGVGGRVVDFLHREEWTAGGSARLAFVLQSFAEGKYRKRRHPWRGGEREDETAI